MFHLSKTLPENIYAIKTTRKICHTVQAVTNHYLLFFIFLKFRVFTHTVTSCKLTITFLQPIQQPTCILHGQCYSILWPLLNLYQFNKNFDIGEYNYIHFL